MYVLFLFLFKFFIIPWTPDYRLCSRSRVNCLILISQTPLHLAVITDQRHLVSVFLRAGASPNVTDRKGDTSVHLAVKHGNLACLECLLDESTIPADIDTRNYEGTRGGI